MNAQTKSKQKNVRPIILSIGQNESYICLSYLIEPIQTGFISSGNFDSTGNPSTLLYLNCFHVENLKSEYNADYSTSYIFGLLEPKPIIDNDISYLNVAGCRQHKDRPIFTVKVIHFIKPTGCDLLIDSNHDS